MTELEAFQTELSRLEDEVIIVEGPKDKRALEHLGLKHIVVLKKPLFEIVEEVSDKTTHCAVLTDLDKEGKKIYGILKKGLQRHRVKVNDRFRNFLMRKTKLRQIEGMPHYLRTLQEKS